MLHRRASDPGRQERDAPRALSFFLLVLALSVPFWLVGGRPLPVPMRLPVSAFSFVCPLVAASVLLFRDEGPRGVGRLLRRAFDLRRIRRLIWYVPMILLLPAVYLLSYWVMRLMGRPLPEANVPFSTILILLAVFFVTALGEETGYMGYAAPRLQRRWSALTAAVILGAVWGALHVVPDVQDQHGPSWILWQRGVYSVALRVLLVWIYNKTGSLFAATLFHATDNVSWALFPRYGSHYDPAVTGSITAIIAVAVTYLWGPRTLAR